MASARCEPDGEWPEIRVDCDTCGCTDRLYVMADVGLMFDVQRALAEDGWEDLGDDWHRCRTCSERGAVPPAIVPKPGAPWQPVLGRVAGVGFGEGRKA